MTEKLILDEFSKDEIDAGRQPFIERVEKKKEDDRIKNFIQTNKDKRKEGMEKISDDMGHNDKIVRHAEPANRFPEDEKSEQRIEDERLEMHQRRIDGMDGNYLKDLEKDLKNCRDILASVKYSEGARLAEVRKRLHGTKELEGRTFEESTSLKSARDHYQKTLDRLKKARIEELEEKNLPEAALRQEMAELIKYFGFCEVVEMNNAEKDAKAESNLGAGIAKKCWGMFEKTANAYNKLPLWQKLGISAGTFALGAAGAIGFVGAKRVLSGVVAGVGTAKGLDALHQRSVGKTADRDVAKIIEEMDKVKFEGTAEENKKALFKLMRKELDVRLENVDERLKKQKMVSLCNKFIGISVGVFLGSGMASKAIAGAWEYFHPAENVPSISLKSYENFKEMNSSQAIAGKDLIGATLAAGHEAPIEIGAPVGPVDTASALHQTSELMEKTITIKEGSNFSKTLLNEFKNPDSDVYKYHPELKSADPHELVRRILMDFKDTHPEMEGHNPDFVAANSEIHFNPASLHADMNEGQYGWYEDSSSGSGIGGHEVSNTNNITGSGVNNVSDASKLVPAGTEKVASVVGTENMMDAKSEFSWNNESLENQQSEFENLNQEHNDAFKEATNEGGSYEKYVNENMLRDSLVEAKKSLAEIATNPNGNYAKTLRNILKEFSDKDILKWNQIEKMNAVDFISPEGQSRLTSLSEKARHAVMAYAKIVPPKADENTGKWVVRFMRIAKDGLIKK